jgi:catechol 2,3-dioxygenase
MPARLSHFEIRVRDLAAMEDFYTRVLGFAVTDRSGDGRRMVFLSADPGEHHQVVLAESGDGDAAPGAIDHLAFRVEDLTRLRAHLGGLQAHGGLAVETVSHGTTWSVYFRDPEGNRLELFVDTPWHVAQPVRFAIDLTQPDDALIAWTEKKISSLAGFQPAERWREGHRRRMAPKNE